MSDESVFYDKDNFSLENSMTPRQIVQELNKYVIGQDKVKRAVAIGLRNRVKRSLVKSEKLRQEIVPNNILIIGPTGTGKTEIARRLASIVKYPFIKVEATKFTEIGYVGRDVEQIIRDLMEIAINMVKNQNKHKMSEEIEKKVESIIVNKLVSDEASETTKNKFLEKIRSGSMEDIEIEVEVPDNKSKLDLNGVNQFNNIGMININDILGKTFNTFVKKKIKIKDARKIIYNIELEKLTDTNSVIEEAIEMVEKNSIVFIDEIDKLCTKQDTGSKSDISREGVQRDLLPLVEGTVVNTKYGNVNTDHILFIASGAFHLSKPSDLLPEFQGRFPVRVEATSLTAEDFIKILTKTEYNLLLQYKALLETEGVLLEFSDDAIKEIADIAVHVNDSIENIGARRLRSILEQVLEEISFDAADKPDQVINITDKYVKEKVGHIAADKDLSRYIL